MDTQPIPFAKSIAGLTVLALFIVAIVAGQAEANLAGIARSDAPVGHMAQIHRIDDLDDIRDIQSLRHTLDSIFDISGRVELRLRLLAGPRSDNENVELPLHD